MYSQRVKNSYSLFEGSGVVLFATHSCIVEGFCWGGGVDEGGCPSRFYCSSFQNTHGVVSIHSMNNSEAVAKGFMAC